MRCEETCTKDRPVGCQHSCPLECHPGNCPPCKQRLRMRCHCNTQVIYSDCQTFTSATEEEKEKIKSCGKSCSKWVRIVRMAIARTTRSRSQRSIDGYLWLMVERVNLCSLVLAPLWPSLRVPMPFWFMFIHESLLARRSSSMCLQTLDSIVTVP